MQDVEKSLKPLQEGIIKESGFFNNSLLKRF